ncbi:MAG: SDR family oxidoreductase [Alphaproteobacteria bacterium]
MAPGGSVTFDFSGQSVLVTGGSSGIGNAIARAFRGAGAKVVITGTREKGEYDSDLDAMDYRQLDMRDGAAVDALAGSLEALDVLVNCAGTAQPGAEYEPDTFESIVSIHLFGTFRLSNGVLPLLKKKGGSVLNIASMTSYFGFPRVPAYGAAKAGVVQMTKTLAAAWAEHGIRVNAIAPGWIVTKLTEGVRKVKPLDAAIVARTPLGRWGEPEEMTGAALFLASPAAGFITGVTLPVDGGYSAV